jgi:hypothetical protein
MYTLCVEVPDGSYTLVPADEDEGAGGDVHYVTVEQDRTKVQNFVCLPVLMKAIPSLIINLCVMFKLLNLSLLFYVHLSSGVD